MTTTTETTTTVLTKNIISFKKGFVLPTSFDRQSGQKPTLEQKMSMQAELMQLGYILSAPALDNVDKKWFNEVISYLQETLGVGSYTPFYKNFPTEVMSLTDAELFENATQHYRSNGKWEPKKVLKDRGFEFENGIFQTIVLGSEDQFDGIFTSLASINQSLTENDKAIVSWFVQSKRTLKMPDAVPFKETLCMLASLGLDVPVKTPTDVLRIAVHFSGGDISLPAVPSPITGEEAQGRRAYFYNQRREEKRTFRNTFKFKKFNRKDRKYLLNLLENSNLDLGEMKLKLERWLRLGEILHPGEFAKRFPKAFNAFSKLRNEADTVQTYESRLDAAFKVSKFSGVELETALNLLSQRPGMFARKLDYLLRTYDNFVVMTAFSKIATKVSRKVLWELYGHFLNRGKSQPRAIMLKGKRSIRKELKQLPEMSKVIIDYIQTELLSCIGQHYSKLEPMGNCWIDPQLKNIPLPTAMRSVNTSVKTYVRGTRIPFSSTTKVVRPYIHWFDEFGYEDLDLSVGLYDRNLRQKSYITYSHLRDQALNCVHSGDVRHRQGRCAEYVDIDIDACLNGGVRYAMVQVHNFNGRPMHTMKDCVFGLMEREFPEKNVSFLPKTISNAMKLANESTTVCVAIFDLEERQYIWADLEVDHGGISNLENTQSATGSIMKGLIYNTKISVYDLLEIHVNNRGALVSQEDADVVFNYADFVTSYDKTASYM